MDLPFISGTELFEILDHAPVALALISADEAFRVMYVNAEFTRNFGYRRDEIESVSHWTRLAYPDAQLGEQRWSFWYSEVQQTRRTHVPIRPRPAHIRCKDGSYREAILQTSMLPNLLVLTYTDITAHVRMERELLDRERRFRHFVEHANDIIYTLDLDGRMTYVSPNWHHVLHMEPDEVVGMHFSELVYPEDLAACEAAFAAVLQGQRLNGLEYRIQQKDGSIDWQSSNIGPIFDDAGKVSAVVGVGRDFSHYKRIEHELKRAKATAEALNDALREANERLVRVATTDTLTGLWNRRRFDETVDQEMARANRHGQPLSMIMFDLDRFKRLNDSYGHLFGDQVLVTLGHIARQHTRTSDSLFRWGGEEFMLLLPCTELIEAQAAAEKLRLAIANAPMAEGLMITASFGVATYHLDESIDHWIGRADAALYEAKQGGRNRVILSRD